MPLRQLSLCVGLHDEATFANFYPGENIELLNELRQFIAGSSERFIYICGGHGSGRSHLLQAVCHERHQMDQTAMYLPLSQNEFSPSILDGMEHLSLVCLDDLDHVLGKPEWDEALFHFYNRVRDNQTFLLVSAALLPTHIKSCLPDLRSRLSWGLLYQLSALSEKDRYDALIARAESRGFKLSDEVARFLLRHYPRDTHALFTILDCLDHASLAHKRKITIPFVRQVLDEAILGGVL